MAYTMDAHDECVVGTVDTVSQIVDDLTMRGHVVTTWTDGEGSKFDLLWSWDATRIGRSSAVDDGPGKLFVGVVGCGCFGFYVGHGYLAPDYVREKLGVSGGMTSQKLAQFITAVRSLLATELRAAR